MKKLSAYISILPIILFAVAVTLSACRKDTDGSPEMKAGTPALGSITPVKGAGGAVVTITGTGLGQITSVVFENGSVVAPFQPNLNTETAIIFRVPMDALGGNQNIILTNSEGKTLAIPFEVLLPPAITGVFPTDFQAGSTVTITGNNLADVSGVVIDGTADAATIVSKTLTQLVITMPASEVNTGKLAITNEAGTTVATQVLVNVDKAVAVITDDWMNGFGNWSWGGTFDFTTEESITGGKSLKAAFDPSGTWGGLQCGNGGSINVADCRYFAFWVKGCDVDKQFQFWLNWGNQKQIVVPANVWTYFKYDMITEFPGVTDVNNVCLQIYNEGKTVYFDNIIFFKE